MLARRSLYLGVASGDCHIMFTLTVTAFIFTLLITLFVALGEINDRRMERAIRKNVWRAFNPRAPGIRR